MTPRRRPPPQPTALGPSDQVQPPDPLLHDLMLFGTVLRRLGLDVGSGSMLDLVRATEYVPIGRKQDFRQAARSLLVHRKQDLALFDEAFRVFWRRPPAGETRQDLRSMGEQRRYRQPQVVPPPDPDSDAEGGQGSAGEDRPAVDLSRAYSAREVLREKDFADYTAGEIADAKGMMARLAWDLGQRRTRRLVPGNGSQLDLRQTLRRSLRYGGEWLELVRRRRKQKPRPLVLICDVSGSMERYTRMLLHFTHTVAGELGQVEAFLFATRLTRVTRCLEYRSIDQSVTEVAKAVPDWAGGTRIGDALKAFNFRWARRLRCGAAVVLIISDGWDRGEPELLAQEMSRLGRSCHRLIWLNPLLGLPSYQPLTRGMQAALPYIDDFLPVHNLNSLEALACHLSRLSPRRRTGAHHRVAPTATHPHPQAPSRPGEVLNPALASTFHHPLWGPRSPR